jgi:uncharacterized BrkB/YihY/UPF0761 family membrane protein
VSGWGTLLFGLLFLGFVVVAEPYRLYGAMGTALVILVFAYWASYLLLACVIFADVFADVLGVGLRRMWAAWRERRESRARTRAR